PTAARMWPSRSWSFCPKKPASTRFYGRKGPTLARSSRNASPPLRAEKSHGGSVAVSVVYIFLAATALWAGLRRFERAMLYVPDRALSVTPAAFAIPFKELWIAAADGVRLN